MKVSLSHGPFQNVNVLGQDYMSAAKLRYFFNYEELTASLRCVDITCRMEFQGRFDAAETRCRELQQRMSMLDERIYLLRGCP